MIKKVDYDLFIKYKNMYNGEYFTNKEIMTIKSICKLETIHFFEMILSGTYDRKFTEGGDNHINRISINSGYTDKYYPKNSTSLYKREDEWFLVTYYKKFSDGIQDRYLIDGFDSLIKVIKEIYD